MNKGAFTGKSALEAQLATGVPHRFVTFEVHDVTDADPLGNEPLFDPKGNIIGRATAGYYGHALEKSLGLGYIRPEHGVVGSKIQIEILGERRHATVLVDSPYDPENKDLRA
jgi:dimethylglycine dehydrogenase